MEVEVVRVWLGDPTDNGKFSGTAFFINENTLVTAKHVIRRYTEGYDIYISSRSLPIVRFKIHQPIIYVLAIRF